MADITITTHPAQHVVALRTRIETYSQEHKAWEQFMAEVREQGVAFADTPCGATFHDPEYRESDIDIEVWQPVTDGAVAAVPLVVRELPAQRVVVASFRGDYSQFTDVNAELADHITEHDLAIAGPMYNRYHIGPADTQNPAEYVTEVCVPVA